MDIFGMGPLEIILIVIIALLLFGPEKLPGIAARAGKIIRNINKATSDLNKTISRELIADNDEKSNPSPDKKNGSLQSLNNINITNNQNT